MEKGNQKLFYKVLKSLRTKKQRNEQHIKDKNQEILTNEADIME